MTYINSEQGILLLTLVVTALTQLASLLSRSERPTWWGLLPAWVDVTTWKPKILQLTPAVVGAGGAVFLAQLQSGVLPADALLPALKAAGLVLLEYHGGKKVLQSLVSKGKPKAPTAVVTTGGAVALLLITGCAGSFEEAKLAGVDTARRGAVAAPSERCQSLDDQHRIWGGIGKGAAVLAGAEGIATWPVKDDRIETGLAIGAGVSAAMAAGAVYVSEQAGESWARECSLQGIR
jgi:hypothetical protein